MIFIFICKTSGRVLPNESQNAWCAFTSGGFSAVHRNPVQAAACRPVLLIQWPQVQVWYIVRQSMH